jgi:predicted RNase H-like HicB family nuclease
MKSYLALVHKDEGTSYGVSFPDVPGCISAGDTFEEAVSNAAEALAGHLALMRADGDPIRTPRTFEELKRDPEFIQDSADAIVTAVAPEQMSADAQGKQLRVPTGNTFRFIIPVFSRDNCGQDLRGWPRLCTIRP